MATRFARIAFVARTWAEPFCSGSSFLWLATSLTLSLFDPTLDNVIVLGLIIFIRTFLSIFLHLEVEHRWPWQHEHPPETNHKS